MKIRIKRQCSCGCGQITRPGNRWVRGHNARCFSEEAKHKMSLGHIGNTNALGIKPTKATRRKLSLAHEGMKYSEETRLKRSLMQFKYNPNYEYCDEWKDREYIKDLRKNYCENFDCKENYKRLHNHHINLNKRNCRPSNVMTLCTGCHSLLHWKLGRNIDPKDYLTIIRINRITYIHKKTRRKIILRRKLL